MNHPHTATVRWRLGDGESFGQRRYSRGHRWIFDGGLEVPASASPSIVPQPWSRPEAVDPEEAFVASLASCHMLFALHHAADTGWTVREYEDRAEGDLGRDADGRMAIIGVRLRPRMVFDGAAPDAGTLADLHHRAHQDCFLANSVRCPVKVIPEAR